MDDELWEKHRSTVENAFDAWQNRLPWSVFRSSPSTRVWGEEAPRAGKAAFEAYLGAPFPVQTPGAHGFVTPERPPTGITLDVAYPHLTADGIDELVAAAGRAWPTWAQATPQQRAGVVLEMLHGLAARSFELAYAVQHTTGQGFVMAFQAGAAHALDRALEAVAVAYHAMTATHAESVDERARIRRRYRPIPRGLALVIGCTTFPTWNGFPGLFASLVCGNPVIVKPHPHAVLPLAITVRECRETLSRYGFPPDLVTLAVEADGDRLAAALALRPEIRLIDYTGSTSFGRWLEDNARQAVVFAEKSGVNAVLLESTADFDGMVSNLASSLALYSGQMCTTPRVLFVPREGIETDQGRRGLDDILASLDAAFRELADDPRRAVALLGAIVDERVERAVDTAMALPNVVIPSRRVSHPEFPRAVVRTPVVVRSDVEAAEWRREWFGPIAFAVPTESADDSVRLWEELATSVGSLTASVYSTNKSFLDQVEQVAATTGVLTALNFTGDVLVNQTVAFADFHGSGANPAANAALVDFGFVAPRFHAAEIRERW